MPSSRSMVSTRRPEYSAYGRGKANGVVVGKIPPEFFQVAVLVGKIELSQ